MNSSNPQIEQLKRMLGIEEKRAALLQQLSALDAQLSSLKRQLLGGAAAPVAKAAPAKPAGRKPGRPPKAASTAKPAPAKAPAAKAPKANARGQLMARILDALKAAGPKGVTIKDLSAKFKMPYRNVQVWFATTGKRNPSIKKIAPATYRSVG